MTATLARFRLSAPAGIDEAVRLALENPGSRYLAGGTDLVVNMRRAIGTPPLLIDLAGVGELSSIAATASGTSIGSTVTLAELAGDAGIAARYRALAEAARAVAGPGHRALASVGGNLCLDTRCIYYNQSDWWRQANGFCLKYRGEICHVAPQGARCHAAFSGDLAPALLALGAEVEIAGANGRRRIPLTQLYVEDGRAHLTLAPGDLLVAVHLPAACPPSTYLKVRQRGAIDFPLAGVAAALSIGDGVVSVLRIALTGTNSRPVLLGGTDKFAGRAVDDTLLRDVDRLVQKQVQPMRTTQVSSNYRRLAAAALAQRAVKALAEPALQAAQ